jgi:hypothetical protein
MRPNRIALVGAFCACTAAAGPLAAQDKGEPAPPMMPGPDMDGRGHGGPDAEVHRVIMEQYYLPEMVRQFSEELDLTDAQVEKLRKATSDARNETDQLEWDVSRENRKLAKLLREGATKEQVYAQMDAVFSFENKIKKKMVGLLIVVRDVLTKPQRERLDKMKADWEKDRHGPGMGGMRGHGPMGPRGPRGDCPMPGPPLDAR